MIMMEADERYIETMRLLVDQTRLDEKVRKEGMSEEILEKQLDINKRRNQYNIMDREEIVFLDEENDDKEFVQ